MIQSTTQSTPLPKLTKRQSEIYEFIRDRIEQRGYGPTVREIGSHFGIRSPNGVFCHLQAIEKKGRITRNKYKSRTIQLTEKKQLKIRFGGEIS
jgi:repressor LexA